jgi:hypothetical protein
MGIAIEAAHSGVQAWHPQGHGVWSLETGIHSA